MPYLIHFRPQAMNLSQYQEIILRLERKGEAEQPGRLVHICFGNPERLEIIDVWGTLSEYQRFGETLHEILSLTGLEFDAPQVSTVTRVEPFAHALNSA